MYKLYCVCPISGYESKHPSKCPRNQNNFTFELSEAGKNYGVVYCNVRTIICDAIFTQGTSLDGTLGVNHEIHYYLYKYTDSLSSDT